MLLIIKFWWFELLSSGLVVAFAWWLSFDLFLLGFDACKIEEPDVGQRLLGTMHHDCTYILICFYISVLADVFSACLAKF